MTGAGTIHLDISQLVLDPRRSGIQRAERELIRHWPGPARLKPCRFDPATGTLHELPDSILRALCEDAPPGGVAAEQARLERHLRPGRPARPERLLNAELFLDPGRAAYYRAFPDPAGLYWLIYDFLPWLHPDWFGPGSSTRLMPYIHALLAVPNLAFISAQTRDDHARRIARRPGHCPGSGPGPGRVIPMGGDGLGLEPQRFDPARRRFVMLGTIEPRKNAAPAMRAFQLLWRQGIDAELTMIGATSPDAAAELALLAGMAGEPRFRHLRDLPDAGVREALRGARAMLFPSEGEGYGIPPMEALHAGIPVIVSAGLPALAGQAAAGQIRLDRVTPETIADAVRALLNDGEARRLWDQAGGLRVPGWADFARGVAEWVQA